MPRFLISIALCLLSIGAFAHTEYPVHLLPDESGEDLSEFILAQPQLFQVPSPLARDIIDDALDAGKRNLDWIKFINSSKAVDQKISLTDAEHTNAYPITTPNHYSPRSVQAKWDEILKEIPEEMKKVIFGGEAFSANPPLELESYKDWARKVDKLYQSAARWRALSGYKNWYMSARENDIRGYYFLSQEQNLKEILDGFDSLPAERQAEVREWLLTMCWNNLGFTDTCVREMDGAIANHQVFEFHQRYFMGSKKMFDDFFGIYNARPDIDWPGTRAEKAIFPFQDPGSDEVRSYLTRNLQDEWRWQDWQLEINFTTDARTHIVFLPDVTPHVNGLGGDEITMNSSAPLTEYDVQWTIRHEFGHVLGFPDCYVEYYDQANEEFVNYQIDTSNLMCSRRGKLKQTHFDKMKANYFREKY